MRPWQSHFLPHREAAAPWVPRLALTCRWRPRWAPLAAAGPQESLVLKSCLCFWDGTRSQAGGLLRGVWGEQFCLQPSPEQALSGPHLHAHCGPAGPVSSFCHVGLQKRLSRAVTWPRGQGWQGSGCPLPPPPERGVQKHPPPPFCRWISAPSSQWVMMESQHSLRRGLRQFQCTFYTVYLIDKIDTRT